MSDAADIHTGDLATPPRYWWLRRIGIAFAALCIVVALVWSGWWWEGRRRLTAELAAIQARGEAWEWDAFKPAPVADGENAAAGYLRATRLVAFDTNQLASLDKAERLPLPNKQMEALRDIIQKDEQTWHETREASQRPAANWGIDVKADYLAGSRLMPWSKIRDVAWVGKFRILVEHSSGDDAQALADARVMLQLAAASRDYPGVYGLLMGAAFEGMVASSLQEIAPDLVVGKGATGTAAPEVRTMIAVLLNERGRREARIRAVECYRRAQFDESCRPGTISGPPASSPIGTFAQLRLLTCWENIVQAATQERWPDVIRLDPWQSGTRSQSSLVALTWDLWQEGAAGGANTKILNLDIRAVLDRRMSAMALALRWYAVEHDGKWPTKLRDLVPAYLPELPRDPFADSDEPIKWVSGGKQPRLYSVGEDGKDDGGSMEMRHEFDAFNRWTAKDNVFFLTRPTTRIQETPADDTTMPADGSAILRPAGK